VTTPAAAEGFLDGRLAHHLRSPLLFRDMAAAGDRVIGALSRGHPIGVFGDYDVDGISGSAILFRFLRALGAEPVVYIPQRLHDGYGVSERGVRHLAKKGVRLMITVDCGATAHREVRLAQDLGIDTIVCDHHQVAQTPLPALAVLNPVDPTAGFPFPGLSGAGVAFYLALGVRARLREGGHNPLPDVRRYLDLVTLGTVADIVPLLEENRVLVKHGLREIAQTTRPGLLALKAVSGVTTVSTGAVGFRLAPRLNAGGRLADARRSLELLITEDRAVADTLAKELDQENRQRQGIEEEIVKEAMGQIAADQDFKARRSIVLSSPEWHPGVIGIVASRLVERFHRPTVLIAIDAATGVGRGSGRSIQQLDLHDAFSACADTLLAFGGHRMAAGLTIAADAVTPFAQAFEAAVRARTREEDFTPDTLVDAEIGFDDVSDQLAERLALLEPYGAGNPAPTFFVRDVRVQSLRVVGTRHLKLYLRQGSRTLPAIGFDLADGAIERGACLDILCAIEHNEWNGMRSLQLRLRDYRVRPS
jgi:single-stranded-DNA-specific exonuclease